MYYDIFWAVLKVSSFNFVIIEQDAAYTIR